MKNSKYLVLAIIILGFFVANSVLAKETTAPTGPKNTLDSPPATPVPARFNAPNTPPAAAEALKPGLLPPLVQQEISKAKANINNTQGTTSTNSNNAIRQAQDFTGNRITKRNEQIKRYVRNVAERFRALINREQQIRNRIQTRIAKLEESGLDMTIAKQLLLETDSSFETIKNQIESLKNNIVTTIESSSTETMIEDLFSKVKTETISFKKEIQKIHTKLVQTLKTMRERITERQSNNNEIININGED